ncbi:hypothetical protein MTO96_032029 [Rhipicephalus appendiculatus]
MLKSTFFWTYQQPFSLPVLDKVVAGKAVLLIHRTTATCELVSFCQRYPDNEFYISRDLILLVKRLNKAGVVKKWHRDTFSHGADFSRCPKVQLGEAETLNGEHHIRVFLLIVVGIGVACAVLLAEMLVPKSISGSGNVTALRVRRWAQRRRRHPTADGLRRDATSALHAP